MGTNTDHYTLATGLPSPLENEKPHNRETLRVTEDKGFSTAVVNTRTLLFCQTLPNC